VREPATSSRRVVELRPVPDGLQSPGTPRHRSGLGGGYTIGKQIDAACVADLHSGQMIWCMSTRDDSGDIQDSGRVPQVMRTLLGGLFEPPPAP
jgi:hypothetical protein